MTMEEKKDVITLNGYPDQKDHELRIDLIAQQLLIYFSEHEYISRVHVARNGPKRVEDGINEHLPKGKQYIVNSDTSYPFPLNFFNVLFISTEKKIPRDTAIENQYSYIVELDQKLSDKQFAEQIVVAWGCWLQGRKITAPI